MSIMEDCTGILKGQIPSWSSCRLWVLRLGYYKLNRPKVQGTPWVWIVDHTNQIGSEKGLLILGLPLRQLPPKGQALRHEDVEPLEVFPVRQSNGEIVYQQLEKVIQKTGIPRQIVSDQGSDLKAGIALFCQHHPQTCWITDIKHKTATILKHTLQKDPDWGEFSRIAAYSRKQLQQSSLAALMPPPLKSKSRYMNLDTLVQWSMKLLVVLDAVEKPLLSLGLEKVLDQLGWVRRFSESIRHWDRLMQTILATEGLLREEGLCQSSALVLQQRWSSLPVDEGVKDIQQQLLAFVTQESTKVQPQERLLGSSEVIESTFGKLKHLEGDQAKNGLTILLLSLAAVVAPTSPEVMLAALASVKTKTILEWKQQLLGVSVQAQRRQLLKPYRSSLKTHPPQTPVTAQQKPLKSFSKFFQGRFKTMLDGLNPFKKIRNKNRWK